MRLTASKTFRVLLRHPIALSLSPEVGRDRRTGELFFRMARNFESVVTATLRPRRALCCLVFRTRVDQKRVPIRRRTIFSPANFQPHNFCASVAFASADPHRNEFVTIAPITPTFVATCCNFHPAWFLRRASLGVLSGYGVQEYFSSLPPHNNPTGSGRSASVIFAHSTWRSCLSSYFYFKRVRLDLTFFLKPDHARLRELAPKERTQLARFALAELCSQLQRLRTEREALLRSVGWNQRLTDLITDLPETLVVAADTLRIFAGVDSQ